MKAVEEELAITRAAHAADKAQLFEAWAKEPIIDERRGEGEGTSEPAPRS